MESTRGFNVKDDLYYINMEILTKNITQFNSTISENYICSVYYKNYKNNQIFQNSNIQKGWIEITKNGEQNLTSKNKFLLSSLKLLEKTNKFRKTINSIKIRVFKNTFYVYKTNIKIDIIAITKEIFI